MKAVLQRVCEASVEVEGETISVIGPGLLCLVGLGKGDGEEDAEFLARRILNGRLWANESTGKNWDLSVVEKDFELLLVSQFTLQGSFKVVITLSLCPSSFSSNQASLEKLNTRALSSSQGNKPDFHTAMGPGEAREFYASFVERIQKAYEPDKVKDGLFGAMMKVNLVNDGPVTMVIDSERQRRTTNMCRRLYSMQPPTRRLKRGALRQPKLVSL